MSRRADRLVEEIRFRRARVRRDLHDLTSFGEIQRRFRKSPKRFLFGTAVAGLFAVRFLAPALRGRAKRAARTWILSRVGRALVTVAVAATARPGQDEPASPGRNIR